jgi:hypothetical protein
LASVTLGKNQGVGHAQPAGQAAFGFVTEFHGGERPRCPVMGTPLGGRGDQRLLHARMAIQAEKTVGAEVDQLPPPDGHAAMVVDGLEDQLLQVDVAQAVQKEQGQAYEAIFAEPRRQPVKRIGGSFAGLAGVPLPHRGVHPALAAVLGRVSLRVHPFLLVEV